MSFFRSLIKGFFFPPVNAPLWKRVLPYAVLGILTLVVLVVAAYGWEYTNSPDFCGTTCHTMPPEYTNYLVSPHARIPCVDCHIGRGFIATRISRKVGDIEHIISQTFKQYEYPIQVKKLRPARETCERCHFPEKFSDDSLREITRFGNDINNTLTSIYLIMKTGGGSKRQGLGLGIHWHIENPIFFLALDVDEQQIPYVRVIAEDGSITEYLELGTSVNTQDIKPEQLKEMDCITCHNRITHLILSPEDTVDQLIARGEISTIIPEIHSKALEVYSNGYSSIENGLSGIAALSGYYQVTYPDFYADNKTLIEAAIVALQDAYSQSNFPDQKVNWETHPNNIGHQDFPGCFRCHDGKHLNNQGEAIRLECNLCHSIPIVVGASDFIADIEISRGPEPESHQNPNWISLHRDVFDQTCDNCHTTENPGGTSNTSFCSNSACHGYVYPYAGFDAPGLREIILQQLPPTPTPTPAVSDSQALTFVQTIGPLFELRCGACHGENGPLGLNLTTYEGVMSGGDSGPVIILGNPEGSLLIQKVTGTQPHFSQFTPEELKLVKDWITLGSPED
ncbi:MAG: NapC/NirT family cytochrome c [Chloroflexota bacterium]